VNLVQRISLPGIGDDAIQAVRNLTNGGVNAAMECVGAEDSMAAAIGITRPGGGVGYVGVPRELLRI
jgi:hypothetical protein